MSNSEVLKQIQFVDSDWILFDEGTPDPEEEKNRRILMVKCHEQTRLIVMRAPGPFRLEKAEFVPDLDDLDFEFIQIGNVICSAFAKRHPVCDVGHNITIQVSYRGHKKFTTKVRLSGTGLMRRLVRT